VLWSGFNAIQSYFECPIKEYRSIAGLILSFKQSELTLTLHEADIDTVWDHFYL
jgi:hypothetical protein